MLSGAQPIPGDLLQAVAQRTGRVTIVVGAGCSLEEPTGLKLGAVYSNQAFQQLLLDGVLQPDDCTNPWDLSQLASAVHDKLGSQAPLVERLPRDKYQFAKPNQGYLLAAALLAEGSIACVATLNFDLALSHAIAAVQPQGVSEVAGPESYRDFGSKAIVYLHRNVNETDSERWILRKEAIEDEWKDGWEAVVAQRIASAPVVVFAGLGSPALALSETLKRVRNLVPDGTLAYLVDPSETSAFASAIGVDEPDHHIQLRWCEFMAMLAVRLVGQFGLDIRNACEGYATEHGITDWEVSTQRLIDAIKLLGLLDVGSLRASWLGSKLSYEPDLPAQRAAIADLLLGLALFLQSVDHSVTASGRGTVKVTAPGVPPIVVRPMSGCGVRPWGAVDLLATIPHTTAGGGADVILAAGFRGDRPAQIIPPIDITGHVADEDISLGHHAPLIIDLDDLRANPSLLAGLVP